MNRHVLIAEDSATQRAMLAADLEAAGFEVSVARDGEEALAQLTDRSERVDLLLSDVVMPRLDGLELCRRIKSDSTLPDLPVVLLTSLQDPLDIVRGLEVGADNFLTKPYEADHLIARIDSILAGREQRTEVGDVTYLHLLGQRFAVTAERQQILELLVGAFEDLVHANHQLRERELELAEAQADLARRLSEVEHERARLAAVLDAIPDGVMIVGPDGRVTDANPAIEELGIHPSHTDVSGTHVRDLPIAVHNEAGRQLPPTAWPIVRAYYHGEATPTGVDLLLRCQDGRTVPVTVTAAPINGAHVAPTDAVAVVRDVSAWAFHDRLTALPNRTLFADRVGRALVRAELEDADLAVLVIQLDRFTVVHDTLGRGAENSVVQTVAQRLVGMVRTDATVARLGSDRFGILLDRIADVTQALAVADRVAVTLENPIRIGAEEIFLSASIGIATRGPDTDTDTETLLRQASTALHRASETGGATHELYTEHLDQQARDRLFLDSALRHALEHDELVVHFQPVIDTATGRIVETEALVRWEHPDRGLIPPGDFIPLAEESGTIVPLGRWVLAQACAQTRRWRDAVPDLRVSVNLSGRQFEEPDLVDDVARVLEQTGLPAAALTLEVTESSLIQEPTQAAATLQRLRALGLRVAIDDFGTGYSSLSYLRTFPLDVLKVDRSFVQQVGVDPQATAIVEAIARLARSLGLEVIAEGIETADQLERMRDLGCTLAAGYLLSRPVPASEIAPLLPSSLLPSSLLPTQ